MHCPAPLPEEPARPLLTKMLVPAPYEAPKKETAKKVKKTTKYTVAFGDQTTKVTVKVKKK